MLKYDGTRWPRAQSKQFFCCIHWYITVYLDKQINKYIVEFSNVLSKLPFTFFMTVDQLLIIYFQGSNLQPWFICIVCVKWTVSLESQKFKHLANCWVVCTDQKSNELPASMVNVCYQVVEILSSFFGSFEHLHTKWGIEWWWLWSMLLSLIFRRQQ